MAVFIGVRRLIAAFVSLFLCFLNRPRKRETRNHRAVEVDTVQRAQIAETLNRWQRDVAFVPLRDEAMVALLPKEEQEPGKKFWTEVETLRKKRGKSEAWSEGCG